MKRKWLFGAFSERKATFGPRRRHAEVVLTVPAATKYRRPGEAATIQPLSSLFDQATHVVLDVVCLELAGRRGVDNAAARTAHANTE